MRIEDFNVGLSCGEALFRRKTGGSFAETLSKAGQALDLHGASRRAHMHSAGFPRAFTLLSAQSGNTVTKPGKEKNSDSSLEDGNTLVMEVETLDKRRIYILKCLLEKLTGKRVRIRLKGNANSTPSEYENRGRIVHESMRFISKGRIKTADGREIRFSIRVDIAEDSFTVPAERPVDPLIINLDMPSAVLGDTKIDFDIDCDGKAECIPFTSPGSGFLSLDLNNDGSINDGSELFGPSSGNGFLELSRYDEDSNNWIDENDSVFEKLRVWAMDPQNNESLSPLASLGIGAIYLGSIETPVSLSGDGSYSPGQIRRTGIFLREDGTVGTIQHVDLNTRT